MINKTSRKFNKDERLWRIDAKWGTVVDGNETDDLIQVLWDEDYSPLPTPTVAVIKTSEKEQFLQEMQQFYPPFSYWWQLQETKDFKAIFVKDDLDEDSYSTFGIHAQFEDLIYNFRINNFSIPSRGVISQVRISLNKKRSWFSKYRKNYAFFDENGQVEL